MSGIIEPPLGLLEKVASLRLPPGADSRLQGLMDRNSKGELTPAEQKDLEDLVEWSESVALLRAEALHLLGRKPA